MAIETLMVRNFSFMVFPSLCVSVLGAFIITV
jgi:hypothetical protein